MSFVAKVAKNALGVVGGLLFGKKSKPAASQAASTLPTRNAAAEAALAWLFC